MICISYKATFFILCFNMICAITYAGFKHTKVKCTLKSAKKKKYFKVYFILTFQILVPSKENFNIKGKIQTCIEISSDFMTKQRKYNQLLLI